MNGEHRRALIIKELEKANSPISATRLADKYGVTRQIIVSDIALLRAAGKNIRSEHRGYVVDKLFTTEIVRKIVCRHTKEQVSDEFYAVVDNGGKVLDVEVEHSIYGLISAELIISSRYEADDFVERIKSESAAQLADLTGGVHIHTIAVKDENTFDRIVKKLAELEILVLED